MGTEDVSIAFRGGHLNMGYDEAVDLRAKLDAAIARVEEARKGFRPPLRVRKRVHDTGKLLRLFRTGLSGRRTSSQSYGQAFFGIGTCG